MDDIPAEFLKLLDERALEILTELCVDIYMTLVYGLRISLKV